MIEDKSAWTGMRTTGQIRYEEGLKATQKKDSYYEAIHRPIRRFNTVLFTNPAKDSQKPASKSTIQVQAKADEEEK